KEMPVTWTSPLMSLLDANSGSVKLKIVDLIRSRGFPGFDEQLVRLAGDPKSADQLRVSALAVIASRKPELSNEQYSFLFSRIGPRSDAVLRQSAARVIGRSSPGNERLLLIARKHLAQTDPLIVSTVLECFQTSTDPEVGEALIAVLRKSPAALGT